MTDTLQFHALEFDDGVVTESGFRALLDAEVYGAASSIGAAGNCVARLRSCLDKCPLSLFVPGVGLRSVTSNEGFKDWCQQYLHLSYQAFLRRDDQD